MGAGPGRTRIYYVGIFCDSCGRQETGDVTASSQRAAEDGLRVDLAKVKGWACDAAGDFCPRCRPAPAVAVTETPPVEESPVLRAAEEQAAHGMGDPELWR